MMRKLFVALLVGAVTVGLAAPAFAADLKFTGAYRVRFQFDENLPCAVETPSCSGNDFQTRFRPRFTVETDGGVRGVIWLEIGDVRFGNSRETGGATTSDPVVNAGGGLGADGINVETKWAYLDFPIPATPLRLRPGIQDYFLSKALILDDEGSGLTLYGKLGEIDAKGWWFRGNVDDAQGAGARDLYGIDLSFSPAKDLSLNVYGVYDHDSDTATEALTGFWFGVGGAGKIQNIRWDLDFVYGSKELTATTEQTGWMVDGGAGMALAGTPLDLELRGWYATGHDGAAGDSDAFPVISAGHEPGTQVWGGGGVIDINHTADNAQNTWGFGLIARYTVNPTLRVTGNVHYIGTVEEGIAGVNATVGDGTATSGLRGVDSVGTEVGVKIDYTLARGLVFTLTAGHLFLGDDLSNTGGIMFDDITKVAGVVNYGF